MFKLAPAVLMVLFGSFIVHPDSVKGTAAPGAATRLAPTCEMHHQIVGGTYSIYCDGPCVAFACLEYLWTDPQGLVYHLCRCPLGENPETICQSGFYLLPVHGVQAFCFKLNCFNTCQPSIAGAVGKPFCDCVFVPPPF